MNDRSFNTRMKLCKKVVTLSVGHNFTLSMSEIFEEKNRSKNAPVQCVGVALFISIFDPNVITKLILLNFLTQSSIQDRLLFSQELNEYVSIWLAGVSILVWIKISGNDALTQLLGYRMVAIKSFSLAMIGTHDQWVRCRKPSKLHHKICTCIFENGSKVVWHVNVTHIWFTRLVSEWNRTMMETDSWNMLKFDYSEKFINRQ